MKAKLNHLFRCILIIVGCPLSLALLAGTIIWSYQQLCWAYVNTYPHIAQAEKALLDYSPLLYLFTNIGTCVGLIWAVIISVGENRWHAIGKALGSEAAGPICFCGLLLGVFWMSALYFLGVETGLAFYAYIFLAVIGAIAYRLCNRPPVNKE